MSAPITTVPLSIVYRAECHECTALSGEFRRMRDEGLGPGDEMMRAHMAAVQEHMAWHAEQVEPEPAEPVAAWHGTVGGYTNHRCRCPDCRRAMAAYRVRTTTKAEPPPAPEPTPLRPLVPEPRMITRYPWLRPIARRAEPRRLRGTAERLDPVRTWPFGALLLSGELQLVAAYVSDGIQHWEFE